MNHKEMQMLVSSLIDGEVTESEKALVKEHMKKCPECREFADQIEQIRNGIHTINDAELEPGFAAHVRDLVVRQDEQSEKWIGIEQLARNAVFAIAVIVLAMFFVTSYNNDLSPGITEVLIDGTGKDSIVTQVLLNQENLSKNDLLYAVMAE
jgi:predicted anti-sigma-YlaC factor YlaD